MKLAEKQTLISIHKTHNISDEHFLTLKLRLESLGFTPGTEVELLRTIFFEHVVVVRIFQTMVALNKMEFACLKF